MNRYIILHKIIFLMLIFTASGMYDIYSKETEVNIWQIKENLAFRLGSEWYKIGLVTRELNEQSDIFAEIRDLELYPLNLTGFAESELIYFDKKIEALEKENAILKEKLKDLNGPLSDAIAILRELVTGEPVESMFDVLEKGDLRRIGEMLSIKHSVEKLWKQSDTLFSFVFTNAGIPVTNKSDTGSFDKEFFDILKANIGQTSQGYYENLKTLKTFILNKATTAEIDEIYNIERHRILEYYKSSDKKIAYKKISSLINLFKEKRSCDEMLLLLAKTGIQHSEYDSVIQILSKVTNNESTKNQKFLYNLQCLYATSQYEAVLLEVNNIDITKFQGASRNLIIWIIIESTLALNRTAYEITPLFANISKNSSYALHSLHAFARSLIQKGDTNTALSALESSKAYTVITHDDQKVHNEIELTIANIYYENGNYETALTKYYSVLKIESMYSQALFGILWCYIQTGQSSKAEIALRKLINQMPESPLAAESILILAKRYLQKAQASWKKNSFLEQEKSRLSTISEKLFKKAGQDTNSNRLEMYKIASNEISALTKRIIDEPRDTYEQISDYYNQIQKVCDLVIHHYHTGTFQETSFSQHRESLLFYIDSVLIQIKNVGTNFNSEKKLLNVFNDRSQIKNIVNDAISFATISLIDKYRWEKEFFDTEKSRINKQIQKVESQMKLQIDSLKFREFIFQKDSLTDAMNVILKKDESIHEFYFEKLVNRLTVITKTNINFENYIYFTYHLGELYYSFENRSYIGQYERYEHAYARYESSLKAFREGMELKKPDEPLPPLLNHDSSIFYFKSIINSNPSEYTHCAHYSLAWCYNDLVMMDSALYHMEIIASQYPSSIHCPQAWMYCGEYYFEKGKLDKANSCYSSVFKYPESEWFDKALYKQAWTQYRLSNPEKAISSFLALVELGEGKTSGKSLLEKESMDYIAISFSETDPTGSQGLDRAMAFIKKLNDTDRGYKILQRLASVYREQGRYDIARKTLQTLLATYPYYPESPYVKYDLITLLEREESPSEINDRKIEFYQSYSRNSQWALAQNDSITLITSDSLAEHMLYDAAIGFHQLALQKNSVSMYSTALNTYNEYIKTYPLSPSANECHYNLAEIHFSIGNYKEAAEEYIAVSKRYPDSKYKETAAWNAIVASQNWLKQERNDK